LVSTQALAVGLRMRLVLYLCLSMLANSCLLRRCRPAGIQGLGAKEMEQMTSARAVTWGSAPPTEVSVGGADQVGGAPSVL